MAWAFNFGRDEDTTRVEDGEILLGEPDKAESESLPLHTDKCARRYRVTILRLNRLDKSVGRTTLLLWVLLVVVILTSDKALPVLERLAKIFGG